MRRFKTDHEGITPDENALFLYKADDTGNLTDSAYYTGLTSTNAFGLQQFGSNPARPGFFTGATPGARSLGGTTAGHFRTGSSSVSVHFEMASDFSLNFWFSSSSGATVCIFEYGSACNANPVTASFLCPLSVQKLANGKLRVAYDRNVGSLDNHVDFDCDLNASTSVPFHIALERTNTHSPSLGIDSIALDINGKRFAKQSNVDLGSPSCTAWTVASSVRFRNGQIYVGGSIRYAPTTNTGSPVFQDATARYLAIDDLCFITKPTDTQRAMASVREARRGWDERRLFESNNHKVVARVLVEDGDGNLVDLSNHYDTNWIKNVSIKSSVDDPIDSASITLMRFRGTTLNLAPLSTTSQLNINAADEFEALIELRRRIRVDLAVVPAEWRIQGWEWEPYFDGYIDTITWNSDDVTVGAIDKMAAFVDAFAFEPIVHDYYDSAKIAENHIQQIVDENEPVLVNGSGATMVFGYLGFPPVASVHGIPPRVYTPASSGWAINYDDTPAGDVNKLIQSVGDQIGWDCRFKWHEPLQQHRLTFYQPPRTLSLQVKNLAADANGFTELVTTIPHGLTAEQSITISGTTNYNGTVVVDAVLTAHKVRLRQSVASAAEAAGSVTYDSIYTIRDTQVVEYQDLNKNVRDIRNAAIVRIQRIKQPLTTSVNVAAVTSGNPVVVTPSIDGDPTWEATIAQLKPGMEFTLTTTPADPADETYSIASITGGQITSNQGAKATGGGNSSVVFSSEYIKFIQFTALSTPSIEKYGLRAAAVYEASDGLIDTRAEGRKLAAAIVNDLAEPTADFAVKLRCAPWFEIHDIVKLAADKKQRWTSDMTMAITSVEHSIEQESCYTTLALRSTAPTMGVSWLERINVSEERPAIPGNTNIQIPAYEGVKFSGNTGLDFVFGKSGDLNKANLLRGRRLMRQDTTEVHMWAGTTGFIPTTSSTLFTEFKGLGGILRQDANGNELVPGTQYHVRYREKDIFGNYTIFSASTTKVVRFNDKPISCKIYSLYDVKTCQFQFNRWSSFPFNSTASPGFDTYNKFSESGDSAHTPTICSNPPDLPHFQMPCNGTVRVEARLGFTSASTHVNNTLAIGVMRLSSTLPGSNASTAIGFRGFGTTESCTDWSAASPWKIAPNGVGHSVMFVHLSTYVDAHTGDYLQIGVFPDAKGTSEGMSGVRVAYANTTGSVSASWVKFTVIQD